MKKLETVLFDIYPCDFREILTAFVAPFPSLETLPEVSEELLQFLRTGEYSPEIEKALDKASCEGRWPGSVSLAGKNRGRGWKIISMVISPYVGDRVLRVERFMGSWLRCTADYSARPSVTAASRVIELLNQNELSYSAEWAAA